MSAYSAYRYRNLEKDNALGSSHELLRVEVPLLLKLYGEQQSLILF